MMFKAIVIALGLCGVTALTAFTQCVRAAPTEHQWWECQRNGSLSCCSVADGHTISPIDWQTVGDHYEVRIESRWWPVPNNKLINSANQCGPEPNEETRSLPKVWYAVSRALSGQIDN